MRVCSLLPCWLYSLGLGLVALCFGVMMCWFCPVVPYLVVVLSVLSGALGYLLCS